MKRPELDEETIRMVSEYQQQTKKRSAGEAARELIRAGYRHAAGFSTPAWEEAACTREKLRRLGFDAQAQAHQDVWEIIGLSVALEAPEILIELRESCSAIKDHLEASGATA